MPLSLVKLKDSFMIGKPNTLRPSFKNTILQPLLQYNTGHNIKLTLTSCGLRPHKKMRLFACKGDYQYNASF